MRIDKFLKVCRIMKRRTIANQACDGGRVKVNGKTVKPSFNVKQGDLVELGFNSGTIKFRILEIREVAKKEQADNMYEIISE